MFRSILCPVDFSAHSRQALRYAAALAARFDARLTALSVSDPLLVAAARAASRGRGTLAGRNRAELSRFVDGALRSFPAPPDSVRLAFAVGDPADEILRTAARLRSDLIVMGTEGLSAVRRLFLGSTTSQVLQRGRVPVLAVPRLKTRRILAGGLAITRVVAPLDLAGSWEVEAGRAAAVARAFDANLLLLHVVRPLQAPRWLRIGSATDRERAGRARRALDRVATRLSRTAPTTSAVVLGDPAREIARFTRRGTPLVAMSLHGQSGLLGRRGSVVYQVVTQSFAPVLALTR